MGQLAGQTNEKIWVGDRASGGVYYMRLRVPARPCASLRVPARFAEVELRVENNKSLKTRDYDDAKIRLAVRRKDVSKD